MEKTGKSKQGKLMHYSVGAIIKKDDKYLLIDRVKVPLGFAGVAGHIDENEKIEDSLKREVREECGLNVIIFKLLFEEELSLEECSRGILTHYWYVYECEVEGDIKIKEDEVKSINSTLHALYSALRGSLFSSKLLFFPKYSSTVITLPSASG